MMNDERFDAPSEQMMRGFFLRFFPAIATAWMASSSQGPGQSVIPTNELITYTITATNGVVPIIPSMNSIGPRCAHSESPRDPPWLQSPSFVEVVLLLRPGLGEDQRIGAARREFRPSQTGPTIRILVNETEVTRKTRPLRRVRASNAGHTRRLSSHQVSV
jgi:hypothetical protein